MKRLEQHKDRLKKAYMNGILEMEDFSEDYKLIDEKLATLENKRINALDFSKETFNPQHLLAQRDIEREKLTEHEMYKDEYRTTIINFNKYPTITFAMAKIMEMSKEEQNQVALYLYNNID